jgi:hypothetical protein
MSNELQEFNDRLALRQLVESYASGCDRRESAFVASLFTPDGRFAIYSASGDLTREERGRDDIEARVDTLRRYTATTHFLGQQTVTVDVEAASGETYCLAHHIYQNGHDRYNRVMAIRYRDKYSRTGAGWLFEDRSLSVDWIEYRPMGESDLAPTWMRAFDVANFPPPSM